MEMKALKGSIKGQVFAGRPNLKSKYKVENDDMNINNIVVSVAEYPRNPKAVGRKFKLGKIDDDHPLKVNVRKAWDAASKNPAQNKSKAPKPPGGK